MPQQSPPAQTLAQAWAMPVSLRESQSACHLAHWATLKICVLVSGYGSVVWRECSAFRFGVDQNPKASKQHPRMAYGCVFDGACQGLESDAGKPSTLFREQRAALLNREGDAIVHTNLAFRDWNELRTQLVPRV